MEQVQVVGVTCLGIYHPLLAHKKFDTCIMDEAGQITLPVGSKLGMLGTSLEGNHKNPHDGPHLTSRLH